MKRKKAFTLVELLIVIAILAILSTVSIIGYSSFTYKAKESNDIATLKQMNTVLDAGKMISDVDDEYDTLKLLVANGLYDFKTQKDNTRFVYDSFSKSILYVDDEGNILNKNTDNIGESSHWRKLGLLEKISDVTETINYQDYFN